MCPTSSLLSLRRTAVIDWNKAFPVLHITRRDLKEAGITEAEIATLTDEDMQHIASKVEDCIDDEEISDHLFTSARNILDFGTMAL